MDPAIFAVMLTDGALCVRATEGEGRGFEGRIERGRESESVCEIEEES